MLISVLITHSIQPFLTSDTDRAGQRAGSGTKREREKLRREYIQERVRESEGGKRCERGGRVWLLFPVTPGQSRRSPPVIELH